MGIITITKKTQAGAPMYDTVNDNELAEYEKKGWSKSEEAPKKTGAIKSFIAKEREHYQQYKAEKEARKAKLKDIEKKELARLEAIEEETIAKEKANEYILQEQEARLRAKTSFEKKKQRREALRQLPGRIGKVVVEDIKLAGKYIQKSAQGSPRRRRHYVARTSAPTAHKKKRRRATRSQADVWF